MSKFDTLAAAADATVLGVMGDTATYTRNGVAVVGGLTVIADATTVVTVEGDNVIRYRGEIDFLIRAADIIISGITVRPKRGDIIAWKGDNYEVTDPVYEPDDPAEIMLRVHGKLIGD